MKRGIIIVLGLVVLLAGIRFLDVPHLLRLALDQTHNLGPWGVALFIGIYVAATVFLLPGSILTLGAGAVFGVVWGSIYVSLASTLGATASFLIGRYGTRRWVAKKIAGNPTFTAIDRAVAAQGWKIVGLTRLSPVFPFALLNYAFGITQVTVRDYIIASWIGMMPGTVLYVYIGSLANLAAGPRTKSKVEWAFYGVGLLATIIVSIWITRTARRALATHTQDKH